MCESHAQCVRLGRSDRGVDNFSELGGGGGGGGGGA